MSIPAAIRGLLGFTQPGTAVARIENNRLVLEPAKDLLSLEGVFKSKKYRDKTLDELKKIQKGAIIKAHVDRYKKSLR